MRGVRSAHTRNTRMTGKLISMIALATALMAPPAMADESQFLSTLKGSWKGSGTVTTKIGSKPIKVNCTFDSTSSGPSLRMNGTCRGLLVIRRAISADLSASGTRYRGTMSGHLAYPRHSPVAAAAIPSICPSHGNALSMETRSPP